MSTSKSVKIVAGQFTPAADRDAMMDAYTTGNRRIEFLQEVEKEAHKVPVHEWREVWDRGDVREAWSKLSHATREAMKTAYPPSAVHIIDYEALRERRVELPLHRGQLRERLYGPGTKEFLGNGSTVFDDTENELKQLSRHKWSFFGVNRRQNNWRSLSRR